MASRPIVPADELHRRGVEAANRGHYGAARRLLARAGDGADADLSARIAGTTAYIMARTGDLAGAEELCRTALAAPGLSPETVGVLAGQLGALAERAGRLAEAERWLGRGIATVPADSVAAARMRVNRSLVAMHLRRLDAAAEDARSAIAVYVAQRMPVAEAQVRHNLGYIALLAGDLVPALDAMLAARPPLAADSAVSAAVGDVDRAEVLRDAGLTTEAERILERAAATFGAHRMPQSRAETEFALARSLLAHDPARAARVAAAAARRLRGLGNETAAARADAVMLRARLSGGSFRAHTAGRHAEVARRPRPDEVDDAATRLEAAGFRGEAAALRLTEQLWRTRHPTRSRVPLRALTMPSEAPMDVALLVHQARAERAAATGRPARARAHAAAGLDALGVWQEAFGSLDLQTSLAAHGAGLVFAGLEAAVRSGRPEIVFEWSERARHLSQRVVPLRPPPAAEDVDELAQLRLLRAADPTGAHLATAGAAALTERLRARQWSRTGAAGVRERLSLDEVRDRLDHRTAIAAYVFTGDLFAAVVVDRGGTRLVRLGEAAPVVRALSGLRADLDMSAAVRSGPLADRIARTLEERLTRLSTLLLDPVARAAGDRDLVVTAPGVLAGLPWGMLPAMRGRAFTLAASATRWARSGGGSAPRNVGLLAGPRVARADSEIAAAAAAWPAAQVRTGAVASLDAARTLAAEADVLHIAAHGHHAVDNPLFSGLELSDGTLFGYDVDRMPRVPPTVVLSACEVGRSTVRGGEEAIGMTRAWLHAGARCVIAAPVVVADDAASEVLAALHAGLAAGRTPARALAEAGERTGRVTPFQTYGAGI